MRRSIATIFTIFIITQLLTSCSSVDKNGLPTTCEGWQEKVMQADKIMVFLTDKYYPNDLYNVGTESDNKAFDNALNWYTVAKDELAKLNCKF